VQRQRWSQGEGTNALIAQTHVTRQVLRIVHRRSDELRRVGTYLAIGALITLENLVSITFLTRQHVIPYVVYIAVAQEVSVLFNFLLNDRFTFHTVTAIRYPWHVRCLRFHSIALSGGIATVGISTVMHQVFHLMPVIAQLIAISTMTFVNFAMHRFWTYRAPQAAPTLTGVAASMAEEADPVPGPHRMP